MRCDVVYSEAVVNGWRGEPGRPPRGGEDDRPREPARAIGNPFGVRGADWRLWIHRRVWARHVSTTGADAGVQARLGAAKSFPRVASSGTSVNRKRDYLMGLAALTVATAVAMGFKAIGLIDANLVMTYLLGIVLVASWCGRGPAVAMSIASVLLFNFLFTTPYYTLIVDDPQYVYTLAVMLAIALIVSHLTARMREHARLAIERERRTEALYRVSHALAGTSGQLRLASVARTELTALLGGEVAVYLFREGRLQLAADQARMLIDGPYEADAAQWAFDHRAAAGRGTEHLGNARALYVALNGAERTVGVLAWQPHADDDPIDAARRRLVDAIAPQVALAVERDWLAQESQRILAEADAERQRSSLLSVVSHDLRTPLAAIAGSASSLVEHDFDAETRKELAAIIYEESDRLSRLVDNLLHLTRIQSGSMRVEKEWLPLDEVIGSALRRVETSMRGREVRLSIPPELPLVPMDGLLMEQVLVNLLDNAAKYSPVDSPVEIAAQMTQEGVEVTVGDRGPGLSEVDKGRVFELFYRGVLKAGTRSRGAGLGLAICRAIVRAHGGRIWADSREGGGTSLTFVLPVKGVPSSLQGLEARRDATDV